MTSTWLVFFHHHHYFSFLVLILIMYYVILATLSVSFFSATSSAVFTCCSLDGIEVRLINALACKMNFIAVFAWPSDGSNWGYVRGNGTLTGMIGTL
jgi:hypothetical protein